MTKRSGSSVFRMGQRHANQKLIDALNEDLSLELQAISTYIVYAAMVQGPYRPAISGLFRAEIADELNHANTLADKIAALGGVPHATCRDVEPASDARHMLEVVLKAEELAISTYRKHLDLAEEAGDIALKVQFENFIQDETHHAEEIRKILAGWR